MIISIGLVLEIYFHIAGRLLYPKFPVFDTNHFVIACIGDSSTAGVGVKDPKKYSYPAQLEQRLIENYGDHVKVVNLGLPGINSSRCVKILDTYLEMAPINLLLVNIGINDQWNFEGAPLYQFYKSESLFENVRQYLFYLYSHLKLKRFIGLLFLNRDASFTSGFQAEFDNGTVRQNENIFKDKTLREKAIYSLLKRNLRHIENSAKKRNIPVFFLEYHAPGWNKATEWTHEAYHELGLNVVPLYNAIMKAAYYTESIRSFDQWHLSEDGYGLMSILIDEFLRDQFNRLGLISLHKE